MWNKPDPRDLSRIPKLYDTENTPWEEKIIYEHYFLGGCDWYVAEYDPMERIYFGYSILNSDHDNAEWGYFAHNELSYIQVRGMEVDRDLHWEPKKAGSIDDIVKGMRRS